MTDQISTIWQELMNTSDLTELRQRIMSVLDNKSLSPEERSRLIYAGVNRLLERWGGKPHLVLEAVEHVIVPVLRRFDDIKIRRFVHPVYDTAPDLLNGLEAKDRLKTRESVLRYLERDLLNSTAKDAKIAHRLICSIGYRDEQLFRTLLETLSNAEKAPDAFTTLLALRVPLEYRERLRPQLMKSIGKADDSAFDIQEAVKQAWLDDEIVKGICEAANHSAALSFPGSILLSILSRLVAQSPSNHIWQQQAWGVICDHYNRESEATTRFLQLNSSFASSVNSKSVIGNLLTWSAGEEKTDYTKQFSLYRLFDRLADCVRPEHLIGWTQAGQHSGEWQQLLQDSARQDTGAQGKFTTVEMQVKEQAWETAHCLGLKEVYAWAEDAIKHETSPYVARSIMQQLACLDDVSFEPYIAELVERPLDIADEEDSGEFFRQDGAITLASSICCFKSLMTLANAGLTSEKHALRSTCKALADVAVTLANKDADRVSKLLLEKAATSEPEHRRDTALYALRELASQDLLDADLSAPMLSFAQDIELPPHSRVTSIEALRLSPSLAERVEVSEIAKLAFDSQPEEVQYAAAEFLVVANALNELSPERIRTLLKLVHENDSWRLEEMPADRAVFALGLLYAQNPAATKSVIVDLIERGEARSVYSPFGNDRVTVQNVVPEIVEAIVNRLMKKTNPYQVEAPLFSILSSLSPSAILDAPWESVWHQWHADGRSSLMEAIGAIPLGDIKQPERLLLLCQLLSGDGQFSVRRTAYMTLAKHFPDEFEKIAIEWPKNENNVEIRKRSAEACAWLSGNEDLPQVLAILLQDPESEVREIAETARGSRLERLWAKKYLNTIQEGITKGEPILTLYKFGHALEKIGDDEIEDSLTRYLQGQSLRPNQANWLRRMISHINKRWRKVTAEWPEPWVRLPGEIEEVDAEVIYRGNSHAARATLWRVPSTEPSEPSSWGGIIVPSSEVSPIDQLAGFFFQDDARVEFAGRSSTEILIGGSLGNSGGIYFYGNGPYPNSSQPNGSNAKKA